ncbi:hypothetical protein J8F10_24295 [Gemmata sp. G18]|uniref:PilZ domain-containing protein n=1 Tax=Gemmata palustris TaxID=2822762 RepID=A0ABS5BXB2_9BACT|nr:hypothetical protein [Gemmata palustris]MBP3958382.1 hypothetical protein [Gemmata palustris]
MADARELAGFRRAAVADESGEDGPLFAPGKCHSRQSNKPLNVLHVKDDAGEIGLAVYMQLASSRCSAAGDGTSFRLVFLSDVKLVLEVKGRELLSVYDYVCQGRISYLQPIAGGVVESISFEEE